MKTAEVELARKMEYDVQVVEREAAQPALSRSVSR